MEKKEIKVSEVKTMVENGLTKKEIQHQLCINDYEMKFLFSIPELKKVFKKANRKEMSIIVINDLADNKSIEEFIPDGTMAESDEIIDHKNR